MAKAGDVAEKRARVEPGFSLDSAVSDSVLGNLNVQEEISLPASLLEYLEHQGLVLCESVQLRLLLREFHLGTSGLLEWAGFEELAFGLADLLEPDGVSVGEHSDQEFRALLFGENAQQLRQRAIEVLGESLSRDAVRGLVAALTDQALPFSQEVLGRTNLQQTAAPDSELLLPAHVALVLLLLDTDNLGLNRDQLRWVRWAAATHDVLGKMVEPANGQHATWSALMLQTVLEAINRRSTATSSGSAFSQFDQVVLDTLVRSHHIAAQLQGLLNLGQEIGIFDAVDWATVGSLNEAEIDALFRTLGTINLEAETTTNREILLLLSALLLVLSRADIAASDKSVKWLFLSQLSLNMGRLLAAHQMAE